MHPIDGRFCFTQDLLINIYMYKPLLALVAAALLFASCHHTAPQEPIRLQGQAQGTFYSIVYYDSLFRDFQPQIDSILHAFDQVASLWVDSSELQRLNRNETDVLSPMITDLFEKSSDICRYTDSAFNIFIGPLVTAWGFSFKEREELSPQRIAQLMTYTHGRWQINQNAQGQKILAKEYPQMQADFNAIAQGYTVDRIAQWLSRQGIQNYLVDVGGEVIARGAKPDGTPWKVGIERPAEDKDAAPQVELTIALRDCSVVTSGSYRKYYEKDGTRYSHTIDPATGHPVSHSLLSVSVIDPDSWRADALATAFMVMGLDKALQFIESHPQNPAVFFIYHQDGQYKTLATPEFSKLIIQ